MNISDEDRRNAQVLWDYMRFEQEPIKSDLIIGLGSSDLRTAEWCAGLYHQGYAPNILFTGGRGRVTREAFTDNEADVYASRAIELGVPEGAIYKEARAASTGDNILLSYELIKKKNLRADSIILVTKPYMLRRTYATFMKQWPDENKPQIYCSAIQTSFTDYCDDPMYPFNHVTNMMVGDVQRIREYPKRGFQIEQDIPEEVERAYSALVERGYTNNLLDKDNL